MTFSMAKYFSEQELQQFHEQGFVVCRGLFADQIETVTRWTQEVTERPEVPGEHMAYYEDSRTEEGKRVLSRIENFIPYHQGFAELLTGQSALERMSELFGEEAVLFKEKINYKLPGGGGFEWHQDMQAGWDTYGSLHITMMITIDEATAENGYLELAPGRHKEGLLAEMWAPIPDEMIASFDKLACPTKPGDAVFFDSFIPHGSGPNVTDRPRRILYVTYGKAAEGDHRVQYYADKRKNYPPDVEREAGKQYVFKV